MFLFYQLLNIYLFCMYLRFNSNLNNLDLGANSISICHVAFSFLVF